MSAVSESQEVFNVGIGRKEKRQSVQQQLSIVPLADFDAKKSAQVSRIAKELKEYLTRVIKEANAASVECEKVRWQEAQIEQGVMNKEVNIGAFETIARDADAGERMWKP